MVHKDIPFQWTLDMGASLNKAQAYELSKVISAVAYANIHQCEVLVLATGFRGVVPGKPLLKKKFPPMK